ncbi:hypothetical protein GF406_05475 [candidate division KSB1 bacterium]|nr:hypothetical protein [candidate division KSB1 bacterium]
MNYFKYEVLNRVRLMRRRRKRIVVVGAGRVGSWAVYYLVKRGYRIITAIDGDRVTEDTVSRDGETMYTFFDLDRFKVDALMEKIMREFPDTSFTKHRKNLRPNMSYDELNDLFEDSVLVIWAVDTRAGLRVTENAEFMLERLGIAPGMHAIHGGGHVVYWIPFVTPCIKHSLGLESFRQINENDAHRSNITIRDIKVVVKNTIQAVDFLLSINLWRFMEDIDPAVTNTLEIEKRLWFFYKRNWLSQGFGRNCPLCNQIINH